MASSYPGQVSAAQVGSYFVGQYYQVLKQHPDRVHQFYADASTMIRVDGDSTQTASNIMEIHSVAMSLNFTAIEIKTINSLKSWEGGILVMVSGFFKTKDYSGRKFVQNFFLAPQVKGYFVLNDIFQFIEDEVSYQPQPVSLSSENVYQRHSPSLSSEDNLGAPIETSNPISEPPVSDYELVDQAADYVNSVHVHDDTVDKYSLNEQQQPDYENELEVEEALEESHAPFHRSMDPLHDSPAATFEDPLEEPPKKTYASILRVAKGHTHALPMPSSAPPAATKSAAAPPDWNSIPEPAAPNSEPVFAYPPDSGGDASEENLGIDDGEPKSVYVRNLPSDITAEEIEDSFKHFGIVRPDGVFIRNRKDVVGVCYAFVEFEELSSVYNAVKASPIQLAGRQVFIEERRPNSGISSRGGRGRGRGRSSFPLDSSSRGRSGGRSMGRSGGLDGGDIGRPRGNGLYQRGLK